MSKSETSCPLTREQVIEEYFMENRAKLLDIAAFLDRLDRSRGERDKRDFRIDALRDGLSLVNDGDSDRTRRLLELFSDPTKDALQSAAGMKGASGVWPQYGYRGGK